jgi:hypothetical protein
MKTAGTVIAILLLVAVTAGILYGIMGGYQMLATRWGVLSDDSQAAMIILSAILIICTLFLSSSIRSQVRKRGLTGTGKTLAYNDFIRWYSELKNKRADAVDATSFKPLRNQLVLWGGHHVVEQTLLLADILNDSADNPDQIITQAQKVFGEIKRELGYRSRQPERDII